jgi:hypothetical protein
MGWFGNFWNESNEYQLPKTLLKKYNQCFSLLKGLFQTLEKTWKLHFMGNFLCTPFHFNIMWTKFGTLKILILKLDLWIMINWNVFYYEGPSKDIVLKIIGSLYPICTLMLLVI